MCGERAFLHRGGVRTVCVRTHPRCPSVLELVFDVAGGTPTPVLKGGGGGGGGNTCLSLQNRERAQKGERAAAGEGAADPE